MNVDQARDLMTTIESFGVLQFIEVAVVFIALGIVYFFIRSQKPIQNATVDALRNAGVTHQQLIEVVQKNTSAMATAERATDEQSRSFVAALERVVAELVQARTADGTQREQLREAVERSMTTYGTDVVGRFDAIKRQLDGIAEQLDAVKAVPDLLDVLNVISARLLVLESLVSPPVAAGAPIVVDATATVIVPAVGPGEIKAADDAGQP